METAWWSSASDRGLTHKNCGGSIRVAAQAEVTRRATSIDWSKDGVIDFWYSENDIPSVRYEDAPYNAYCEYCKNEVDSLDIDT